MENQNSPQNSFSPPRHWIGTEELSEGYWNDPKAIEKRGQEFHDKPVETIDLIDKLDSKGIARRDFLTIMGASMAMASFACARRPVHKIIPYVVKPEEITAGVANFYATSCPDTGYGLLVKVREGRPVKLEGNPEHPMNKGTLSARGQAALLDLYDPDRTKEPMSGDRNGNLRAMSWVDADAAILAKLRAAGRVRVLSGNLVSDSTRRLLGEFLAAFNNGSGSHVEFDALANDEVLDGQLESYGTAVIPNYRFDQAKTIISFGADFLGTWVSPVEFMSEWAKRRKLDSKNAANAEMSKMYVIESTMTLTGANADERLPVRPGDELKVALAVAHEIIVGKKQSRFASDATVGNALSGYTPQAVSADTGVSITMIQQMAEELLKNRGKSVVVAGSPQTKSANAVALQIAVNFLNSALDNEGVTVDGTANPNVRPGDRFAAIEKLIGEMKAGAVDALIIYGSNPVYNLPKSAGFEEAMKKVPLVVAVSDRDDETARLADYLLPDHHFLENWGDASGRKGVVSLQQPVISPIHSTRAFQDTLLTWIKGGVKAGGLAGKVAASADAGTWRDYVMANWQATHHSGAAAGFELFWEGVLRDGVFGAKNAIASTSSTRAFRAGAMSRIPAFKKANADEILLALYAKVGMYDGRSSNNPWLQEFPEPISTATWDNYLNVGPALATKLGIQQDDIVEITGDSATVQLPVNVQPGMHPLAVSIALGYGRRNAGKVGTDVGMDVAPFIKVVNGALVYSGHPVKIRRTGKVYRIAITQWHNATENRPIINDISLTDFIKKPSEANETDPELRLHEIPTLWPAYEYKGYRWGMAIDLNSCTGCGACVIGCMAENNTPVVGRNNVRVSREMHWIRLDRYYSGSTENPDVVFQPMLCQHCENAPCESVCPVLATVHDDEGMNSQIYNRCVGTRYCQNNCPYKVRRFNFFDHWKSYEGTMNLAWNPDVTVRTRGIMEKCTFCVQRIRGAKDKAKDEGRKLLDGELKPACQQTCPTDAIIFGDINDPNSRVSQLRGDARAFRVLEILNVKPSISYMTKVRNKEKQPEGHTARTHGSEANAHKGANAEKGSY
ncbi:MAG: 4Fe-4S dicluster domain-containing protein [Methylotenera sp.]|nr:4Fe-4S dicluster domain-containing protein [Oligoflexia bacterium]